ncbi:MAG: hypothetical protein OEY51_06255 [Cyclobacteriaceae bacterium]|nr:hypothetical protein [Cyclobacteriaceae bacterium]
MKKFVSVSEGEKIPSNSGIISNRRKKIENVMEKEFINSSRLLKS